MTSQITWVPLRFSYAAQLPVMRRCSCRLREVVAYETRTAGSLLQREVPAHLLFGKNLLRAIFRLQYTAVSRKVVGKNVHARIPKGNMGYNQYTVF